MSISRLILLAALLPAGLYAAEKLEGDALDNTFIPILGSQISCSDDGEEKKCVSQPSDTTRSLTDKALRDAENRVSSESVANPNLNNPNALPPSLPRESATPIPTPQDLINMWNSRPPM